MEKQNKVKTDGNERKPGQGNSNEGITRRLGSDIESRGEKERENLNNNITGEELRLREGSQGGSKGQKNN